MTYSSLGRIDAYYAHPTPDQPLSTLNVSGLALAGRRVVRGPGFCSGPQCFYPVCDRTGFSTLSVRFPGEGTLVVVLAIGENLWCFTVVPVVIHYLSPESSTRLTLEFLGRPIVTQLMGRVSGSRTAGPWCLRQRRPNQLYHLPKLEL